MVYCLSIHPNSLGKVGAFAFDHESTMCHLTLESISLKSGERLCCLFYLSVIIRDTLSLQNNNYKSLPSSLWRNGQWFTSELVLIRLAFLQEQQHVLVIWTQDITVAKHKGSVGKTALFDRWNDRGEAICPSWFRIEPRLPPGSETQVKRNKIIWPKGIKLLLLLIAKKGN